MRKDKYLQIFNYLKEFSKIRSNPVRDIDAQETKYPEKFWLNDIPENELFENIIRPNFSADNDYWLKVKKPKEPVKPKYAELTENLEKWIDKDSLYSDLEAPRLKETLEINEKTLKIEDFPDIEVELIKYVENKRIDDLTEYQKKIKTYQIEYAKYDKLNFVYKQLFRIFNKTEQFGEEYELVLGLGLLNFKENHDKPRIFRHILTQRVDINFEYSQNDSQIIISPNIESSPQIETDSILDLIDQFDSQNIIDAEKLLENYIKEKNIDTMFSISEDALQMFAERISPDGSYDHFFEKPNNTPSKPIITFSPALLLRKRNTQSFTALYENILENIEYSEDNLEIPTINDLIGIPSTIENDNSSSISSSKDENIEHIFFPKEYNVEQLEIIEKTKRNNKVLVQGPPGTGKSHTIANLICHLLANGNKVLVTAYTKRALEVLKEKLPAEFQDLTVNLLSGDSSSIQDLQSSVNAINEELSRASLNRYAEIIKGYQDELKLVRRSIAETSNGILQLKEKATRKQKINDYYEGTLTEISEKLEKDSIEFAWYKDNYSNTEYHDLLAALSEYIQLNKNYAQNETKDLECVIPEIDYLLTPIQIKEYTSLKNKLKNDFPADVNLKIACSDFEQLKQQIETLQGIFYEIENIKTNFHNFDIIDCCLAGRNQEYLQILNRSKTLLDEFEQHDLRQFDKDIDVAFPQNKSLKQLKNDAQIILAYLNKGNSITGFTFSLKKPFLPREIKERLYFIDSVKVNGSPCYSIEDYELVLNNITFQQDFIELSQIWNTEIPQYKFLLQKFSFFKNIDVEVRRLLEYIEVAKELKSVIESISSLKIVLFDNDALQISVQKVEYSNLEERVSAFLDLVNKSTAYLNKSLTQSYHPIKDNILQAYNDLDYHAYSGILNSLENLLEQKQRFLKFKSLRSVLSSEIPEIIELVDMDSFTTTDIENLKTAIYFRNAQHQIKKLLDVDFENQLIQNLNELERKERKLIAMLASKKAWYKVIESLQQNRSLRQHLDAWVMAVKKIGRTGKGKTALKFRKIAQQEMEYCKDSVPCWIMPLYKVAETIQPKQEMYDYVIIDEASQLGPDAIFLLYITKNIIIVGDDKQTSPEYVGIESNSMVPHIKRHLQGIPFSDYYGTEFSFFDHAKFFCDGVTVLREHFRCMPEIIEFSNRHFYAPDGKGLYPLKQYSENRLEPLISIFCSNGYIEGTGSRIINEPEANQIAVSIANLVVDTRYNGKTIGVITLQGNQQASLIENLVLKKIGEQEFHKRKIVCGNSSSFQGDERDVIFLSLVTAHNHHRSAFVKPEDERRFNVAVSRAKEQIWLFHSVQLNDLSNTNDLRYKLLDHFKNYNSYQTIFNSPIDRRMGTQPEPFDSWFEVDVYNDIIKKNISIIPQYEVAKGLYKIDMVALLPNGTKIAIECDGDKWHGPEQHQNDIMRQKVLERCGWQFFRVRGYEYYTNREKALIPLWNMIPDLVEKAVSKSENNYQKNYVQNATELKIDYLNESLPSDLEINSTYGQNEEELINPIELLSSEEQLPTTNPGNSETWESKTLYWSIIEKPDYHYSQKKNAWYRKKEDIENTKENYHSDQIFEKTVKINCVVKIKYLGNEKELKVKLVEYHPNGIEIINGVQLLYFKKPLGTSINGKTIGDRVKIIGTDSEVEIIEII